MPLRAIYLLDEIRDKPGPTVEGVTEQVGLLSLVANSFATNMLDSEMRANEFKTLSSLVAKVPLRRLFTSKGQLAPADLCQAVLRDLTSLTPHLDSSFVPPLQLELAGVPRCVLSGDWNSGAITLGQYVAIVETLGRSPAVCQFETS